MVVYCRLHWLARHSSLLADIILGALLIGPVAAPALGNRADSLLLVIAHIIYAMGSWVCPQPWFGLPLEHGHTMAVCMRCYGTVLGITATRLLYSSRSPDWFWFPNGGKRGLLLFATLIFAYPLELAGQQARLWHFDHAVVTIVGLITGIGLGLMFHPVLQSHQRANLRGRPT